MDNFCIIVNDEKDRDNQTAESIIYYLESQGKKCSLAFSASKEDREHGIYTYSSSIPKDTHCVIVLGGDGTIIQAAKDLLYLDIPLLGVNLGTVGYLAEIEKNTIKDALSKLFLDNYSIEERFMLYGRTSTAKNSTYSAHALNDIVICKTGKCNLILVNLYINDVLIDTYIGDGVIVATPTGSTGYNLSAGGPVLKPGIDAIVITPICPHSLNKRSLVVSGHDTIMLEFGQRKELMTDHGLAFFDGTEEKELISGDTLTITKATEKTKIVKMTDKSYFDTLKNKLGKETS